VSRRRRLGQKVHAAAHPDELLMPLTDAERKLADKYSVGLYPAPCYQRFPVLQAAGWQISVVQKADFLFTAHGETREAALENVEILLKRRQS